MDHIDPSYEYTTEQREMIQTLLDAGMVRVSTTSSKGRLLEETYFANSRSGLKVTIDYSYTLMPERIK